MLAAFGALLLVGFSQFDGLVELEAPRECNSATANLQARFQASVVGASSGKRRAHVVIERHGARYSVEIYTYGDTASGTKRISTSSCDEAVSTTLAVLALALSDASAQPSDPAVQADDTEVQPSDPEVQANDPAVPPSEPTVETRQLAPANEPAATPTHNARPQSTRVDTASNTERDEPSVAPHPVRLGLRAGIDAGTLASATAYLAAVAALPWGPVEWRALVAYGLPSVEERIDPGIAELRREHFVLLDLGGCYGFGRHVWLAACAAGEMELVQGAVIHSEVADEHTWLRLGWVLAAHFAYRGGVVQPDLEFAAAGAALGAGDARWLAVRASLGIGLQF